MYRQARSDLDGSTEAHAFDNDHHTLDISSVPSGAMQIAQPFKQWYEKHAPSMLSEERNECHYMIEHLQPSSHPSQHRLYKRYIRLNIRDYVWPVFWVFRKTYGHQVRRTNLPKLIQERYGTTVDLWTIEYPGPPPPRPADWPPLGEKWISTDIKNRRFKDRKSFIGPEVSFGSPADCLDQDGAPETVAGVATGGSSRLTRGPGSYDSHSFSVEDEARRVSIFCAKS